MFFKIKEIILRFVKFLIRLICYCILCILSTCNKIRIKRKIDNSSKRIMILIGKISKGGAERIAINLAHKLGKCYEVFVVTYCMSDKENKYMENVEEYECSVKHFQTKRRGFRKIYEIRRFKKNNNITHCISFGTIANFMNSITRVNDKVIIGIVNYLSVLENKFELKTKHKISIKLSDYIVSNSKQVEYDQIKNYHINPNKSCVIPTYCNKKDIHEAIEKYDIDEEDKKIYENGKVIITVGKMKVQKGQWHLIRAFQKVVEEHKEAKLIILGTGKLEEYLKNLIVELNLQNHIYVLGHKNKNIYTYMKKAEIFAFPSLFEGMPNVILEAMECGLPVIATDCYGGNKEIIEPSRDIEDEVKKVEKCEYGILIPKLDFKQYGSQEKLTKEEVFIAEAINEMLDDKNLLNHYKEKSLERVKEYNNNDDYLKKWEEIL